MHTRKDIILPIQQAVPIPRSRVPLDARVVVVGVPEEDNVIGRLDDKVNNLAGDTLRSDVVEKLCPGVDVVAVKAVHDGEAAQADFDGLHHGDWIRDLHGVLDKVVVGRPENWVGGQQSLECPLLSLLPLPLTYA